MTDTAEIRWFRPGEVPASVADWFDRLTGNDQARRARVDLYVRASCCPDLGIKLRDGRLEMKQRIATGAIAGIGRSAGVIERWRKVAFDAAPGLAATEHPLGGLRFRHVAKDRWIGWLEPGERAPRTIPVDASHETACQVELATVRLDGTPWWTVGFEWACGDSDRSEALARLAGTVMDAAAAPRLEGRFCAGYPAWLMDNDGP